MKHCIDTNKMSREDFLDLITLAEKMIKNPQDYTQACKGKQLATLFYEASTRTRLSFTSAMLALGGTVLGFSDEQSTSMSKGESLTDTTRIVAAYADIIAMRHYREGAALAAAIHSSVPVINAGDGSHAHPTQTLTDLLTIHRELGRLDHLSIGICGDLKFGRTVHSLIKAMAHFKNIHLVLIATPSLGLPEYMLEELNNNPNLTYTQANSLEEAISSLDILYMTRVQKERFESEALYENCKGNFILDREIMQLAKKDMRVLHPLPRVDEIRRDLDDDPRMAYFRQAHNGKYIRMALICTLLGLRDKCNNREDEDKSVFKEASSKLCANKNCITSVEELRPLIEEKQGQKYCAYCERIIKT